MYYTHLTYLFSITINLTHKFYYINKVKMGEEDKAIIKPYSNIFGVSTYEPTMILLMGM